MTVSIVTTQPLEAKVQWVRSSYCDSDSCFEIGIMDDMVVIRNGNPFDCSGMMISGTKIELKALIDGMKNGDFDHLVN